MLGPVNETVLFETIANRDLMVNELRTITVPVSIVIARTKNFSVE
jgi:hypothetical protein